MENSSQILQKDKNPTKKGYVFLLGLIFKPRTNQKHDEHSALANLRIDFFWKNIFKLKFLSLINLRGGFLLWSDWLVIHHILRILL